MTRHRYREPVARPPQPDHRRWFVLVSLDAALPDQRPKVFAIGPAGSWSRARALSDDWERRHGPHTAEVTHRIPTNYAVVRQVVKGSSRG